MYKNSLGKGTHFGNRTVSISTRKTIPSWLGTVYRYRHGKIMPAGEGTILSSSLTELTKGNEARRRAQRRIQRIVKNGGCHRNNDNGVFAHFGKNRICDEPMEVRPVPNNRGEAYLFIKILKARRLKSTK